MAETLNDLEKGTEAKPFSFQSAGMLAYIGDYKGLTDLPDFKVQGNQNFKKVILCGLKSVLDKICMKLVIYIYVYYSKLNQNLNGIILCGLHSAL